MYCKAFVLIIIIFSAPRKPKGNAAAKELVSLPPSPPQVDQMEVIQEEAVVVEETPKVGVNVEQLAGMVSNVDVSNDVSKASLKCLCILILTIM